jgi:hypothetical protein
MGSLKLEQDRRRSMEIRREKLKKRLSLTTLFSLSPVSHTRVASSFLPLFVDVRDGWMDLALA